MKRLEGVVVKFSEVNKYRDEKGNVHILHCDCIKDGLVVEDIYLTHSWPVNGLDCNVCKSGLIEVTEGDYSVFYGKYKNSLIRRC